MLSRSALGSAITQFTSHFHGPRRGGELRVVLVDNTRSDRLGFPENDEPLFPSFRRQLNQNQLILPSNYHYFKLVLWHRGVRTRLTRQLAHGVGQLPIERRELARSTDLCIAR
jgi:hypothetical protein